MRKILLLFFLVLTVISCEKESIKKEKSIYGQWELVSRKHYKKNNYKKCNYRYLEFRKNNVCLNFINNVDCIKNNVREERYSINGSKLILGAKKLEYKIKGNTLVLIEIDEEDDDNEYEKKTIKYFFKSDTKNTDLINRWFYVGKEFDLIEIYNDSSKCKNNYITFDKNSNYKEFSYNRGKNCKENIKEKQFEIRDNNMLILKPNQNIYDIKFSFKNDNLFIYEIDKDNDDNNVLIKTYEYKRK